LLIDDGFVSDSVSDTVATLLGSPTGWPIDPAVGLDGHVYVSDLAGCSDMPSSSSSWSTRPGRPHLVSVDPSIAGAGHITAMTVVVAG